MKQRNLKLIFTLQGHQRFKARFSGLTMGELLREIWNVDIRICPACGGIHMRHAGRIYAKHR